MKISFLRALILFVLLEPLLTQAAEPAFSTKAEMPKARVVVVHDAKATEAFAPHAAKVREMVERGLLHFTGKTNLTQAWRSLVSTNDVIGLKVFSSPGDQSGTRPAVVAAVIETLLAAGISPKKIVVWDRHLVSLQLAGYDQLAARYKVRIAGAAQSGWDGKIFYENPILGKLVWGDLEFEKKDDGIGRKSHLSQLVTKDITKIVNITPMMNHNYSGVTGNLYSLALGSIDNAIRFENSFERLATAVPEIIALPELYDRITLNIVDGLICQYEGEQRSLLHYSAALNELRFSKDPVALDTLSLQELDRQRELAHAPPRDFNPELYKNASLLELGVSEMKRIVVEKVPSAANGGAGAPGQSNNLR